MAVFGISGKNVAQKEAIRRLKNDKPFIFLTGQAGTGKTLVAQAVGLDSVLKQRDHRKLIYTRLQTQVGMDVGALPGDLSEKTYPFIAPFMDGLDVIDVNNDVKKHMSHEDESKKKIFFDSIQTIRGRSLNHTYLLVDESQNLDIHTMAALATRPGLNAKFVFMGNFSQIDSPKLRSPKANGMFQLLHGLYEKGAHEYFDHINFTEVQRHPVVEIVEDILRNHEMAPEFAELESRGNISL